MKRLVIVGAGGFGKEVVQYARYSFRSPEISIRGVLDDSPEARARWSGNVPCLGSTLEYQLEPDDLFIIAIGEPRIRRVLAMRLQEKGANFAKIVHPRAYLAETAQVEEGAIVCPFAFVGPSAKVGPHAVLNTFASAGHDSEVEGYSVLSPYAVINGHAKLERGAFLATHATVVVGKRVGEWAKVSAGSIVHHDVPAFALAVGNPAKSRVLFDPPVE